VNPLTPYRAGAAVARVVPEPVSLALATCGGRAVAARPSERRRMLRRHLRRVLGPDVPEAEVHRQAARAMAAYARYWVDAFRVPSLSGDELERSLSFSGREHIEAGLAAGRGVILALPHLGGWELAGAFVAAMGDPITVVVEALRPPEVFRWFAGLRQAMGMTVVPADAGAGAAVARALKANEAVCLLSDRDLSGTGVPVDFFGERTTLPGGPATLALRTGAPLVPIAVYASWRGHEAVLRPPLDTSRRATFRADVARVTQDLAAELEILIRRAPDQWHLLQPNWPSDREPVGAGGGPGGGR
jgi:KDO2-lipid IV(A) lauroyltransferase